MARFDEVSDRGPRGIAGAIARQINAGELSPGDRLPTVREVAAELGVSPATVSEAWQALRRAGLITSRGRAGSFVREAARPWLSPRMQGLVGYVERHDFCGCLGGRLTSVDCATQGPGFTCQSRDGSFFCGLAADCVPSNNYSSTTTASCDGSTLSFCNAGRVERVDCAELGFSGCDIDKKVDHYGCIPGPVIQ